MKHRRSRPAWIALFAVAFVAGAVLWPHQAPALKLPVKSDVTILALLDHAKVVATRPNPDGYDRDCGPGAGCVFGTAWKDVDRNGCDTRNDVLGKQLTEIVFKPGTRQCKVKSGKLRDPYTGGLLAYPQDQVEIDHVVPLAYAWDMGANAWPADRRVQFANDPSNLVAASRAANRAKSDKSPDEWVAAVAPTLRCDYVKRFLTVADGYGLPITRADADAIREAANACT